jgi:hypothetical protein
MCMLVFLLAAYSGRTLVFLNAISSIRRVGALLKLLGISAQVCDHTQTHQMLLHDMCACYRLHEPASQAS